MNMDKKQSEEFLDVLAFGSKNYKKEAFKALGFSILFLVPTIIFWKTSFRIIGIFFMLFMTARSLEFWYKSNKSKN